MTNDTPLQGRALRVPAARIARLGRFGAMAGGIAVDMAVNGARQWGTGRRPAARDLLLTPANLRRIADDLARMRGAAMKIGQLISMDSGDVLPPELAEILARLRADAHFMPPRQLGSVLDMAWGRGWRRSFRRFDVRPVAAASIGQVHRAVLCDGREIAVKVQYPGIARSIDSDVSNVGALIRLSGLVPKGFHISPYLDEARRQLHDEADYLREGAELDLFGARLAGDDRFVVPVRHPDWTTGTVLAMDFVEGRPMEAAADAPQAARDRIATSLFELMLRELFVFGHMQTDPNFANYRLSPDGARVILLDFGATRAFSRELIDGLARLMRAGMERDRAGMDAAARELGCFPPGLSGRHRDAMLDMMEQVQAAMLAGDICDFGTLDIARRLQADGMALVKDGLAPPPVPVDILYIQRKTAGMFLLARRLRARVPLRDLVGQALAARG